ncbi:MAG: hypothetical protein WD740_05610 [Anaerolineales bacterium]
MQRELRRANHLMAVGDHLNAAEIFVSIANKARDLGIVYPAPLLFLRAAHAYLLGEIFDSSIQQAKTGLSLLTDQERWAALYDEGERYILSLDNADQKEMVQHLRAWLAERLQGRNVEMPPQAQLPEKCSYCGASMSMEQIDFAGGRAAECHYCGSVVLPRSSP